MAAITYGAAPAASTVTAKPSTSIWTRLWNAFIEARTRQAIREISLHRHLMPAEFEELLKRNQPKINP